MSRTRNLLLAVAAVLALLLAPAGWSPVAAASATARAECHASPGRALVVATVPKVVGFVFSVGDRRYRTGPSGRVRIAPVTCADAERALGPISGPIDQGGGTTAVFDGWYGAQLVGQGRGDGTIYAAFRQTVRVDLSLVDLTGKPVDRAAVGGIGIKGSTGAEITVPPGESSVVLDASRVVRFSTGLVSKDILWSVQTVDLDGNSAVNRGETRFEPRHTRDVTIPLMLFPLRVDVHDVILHRPVGDRVLVMAPDGSSRTVTLGSGGQGGLGAVARGHYVLKAGGASIAMGFEQPVAVSRPQQADLTVISYLDLVLAGGAFLALVVGLFLVGWRLHRRGPHADPVAAHREPAPPSLAGAGVAAGPRAVGRNEGEGAP